MRKKLFIALAFQIILAVAVLLSPLGITELVDRYGSEAEFRVTEAYLNSYYSDYDDDSAPSYQLDMSVVPLEGVKISRRISNSDSSGNSFGYEKTSYSDRGWCSYRFKDAEAQQKFAEFFDGGGDNYGSLKKVIKENNVTVKIRYFRNYVTVLGVYINGEDIEEFTLQKGFSNYITVDEYFYY